MLKNSVEIGRVCLHGKNNIALAVLNSGLVRKNVCGFEEKTGYIRRLATLLRKEMFM